MKRLVPFVLALALLAPGLHGKKRHVQDAPVGGAAGATATAVAATGTAQPAWVEVHGRVTALGSPDPVADAVIEVEGAERAASDAKGEFTLRVPAGPASLLAYAQGCQPLRKKFPKGLPARLTLGLRRTSFEAAEVTIRGRREKHEVSRTTVSARELAKVPGTGGDPVRALQSMPGMVSAGDFSGALVVRGGGPNDNLYLLDGVPWSVPFHFGGFLSTVSADLIDRVDLYAAAFPSRFGGGVDGAVLDVATRPGKTDRVHVKADLNVLNADLLAEGPAGFWNGSWTLQGRRSYFDLIVKGMMGGGFDLVYQDLGGTLDLTPARDHHIRLLALVSDDEAGFNIKAEDLGDTRFAGDMRYINTFQSYGGTWTWTPRESLKSDMTLYYNAQSMQAKLGMLSYDTFPQSFGARERLQWDAGRLAGLGHSVEAGAEYVTDNYRYYGYLPRRVKYADGSEGIDDFRATTVTAWMGKRSAWLQDRLGLAESLSLTLGGRYDKADLVAQDCVMPRTSLEWKYDENTTWRAAWGVYCAMPNAMQMDAAYGNPGLEPGLTQHTVLGLDKRLAPRLTARVEAYNKSFERQIVSTDDSRLYANDGEGWARGVELSLRQELTDRLYGWVSYAYSRSQRRVERDGAWEWYRYDQPHVANLVAGYNITPQWTAGAKLRWNSGPLYTPLAGRSQSPTTGVWNGIEGEPYSRRLEDYLRLDLRSDYSFWFMGWRLNLYLECINALNRANPQGVSYEKDYSDWDHPKVTNNFPRFFLAGVGAEF